MSSKFYKCHYHCSMVMFIVYLWWCATTDTNTLVMKLSWMYNSATWLNTFSLQALLVWVCRLQWVLSLLALWRQSGCGTLSPNKVPLSLLSRACWCWIYARMPACSAFGCGFGCQSPWLWIDLNTGWEWRLLSLHSLYVPVKPPSGCGHGDRPPLSPSFPLSQTH